MQMREFLYSPFLDLMEDVSKLGKEQHGHKPCYVGPPWTPAERGSGERAQSAGFAEHAREHFNAYLRGELHEQFESLEHQLAAVAVNAMLEYFFLKQESANSKQGYWSDSTPASAD